MKFLYFVCELIEYILQLVVQEKYRELYYFSRSILNKSCESYTFDRCLHRGSSQKSSLGCGDAKKEDKRTSIWAGVWLCGVVFHSKLETFRFKVK